MSSLHIIEAENGIVVTVRGDDFEQNNKDIIIPGMTIPDVLEKLSRRPKRTPSKIKDVIEGVKSNTSFISNSLNKMGF